MIKYIGIKPADSKSKGNEGDIWYKNSNGVYVCKNKRSVLQEKDILHDLEKGYLKKLEE